MTHAIMKSLMFERARKALAQSRAIPSGPEPRSRHAAQPHAASMQGRCACGGGCPRCQAPGSASMSGGLFGKPATPAPVIPPATATPEPAPAPAPEVVTPQPNAWVTWSDTWGPKSLDMRADGQVGQWYVDFRASPASSWLIQRIQNVPTIEHVDGSTYPGESALPWYPPTLEYYEAWWVDDAHKIKNPESLTTPPKSGDPSTWGDDLWNFNSFSSKATKGSFEKRADFYMVSALPPEFGLKTVPDAGVLPSTTATSANLGPSLADRAAKVTWNYDPTSPSHEIATT